MPNAKATTTPATSLDWCVAICMKKLASLYLDGNQIVDLSPLKGLTWISSLGLRDNQIKDVSPLSEMTELRYTFLQNNEIDNVAPLVDMAQRDVDGEQRFAPYWHLYLGNNPVGNDTQQKHIDKLVSLGVRVNRE